MAYELGLPPRLKADGWRAKIRDKECVEPPHVSVLHKTRVWRWSLRRKVFIDREPPQREVSSDLVLHLESHWQELAKAWDEMYPHNPVNTRE
jgi:hypothetical protein